MHVYYYKVLGRLGPMLIPGEGEKDTLLPGDTLQVGEAGHSYIQSELCPFKDAVLLVGSTFLGENSPPTELIDTSGADQILSDLLEDSIPVEAQMEEAPALALDAEEPFPELPVVGAKVSEVMQYLRLLELKGYTLEQLDEVKNRFSSVTIQREVERLRQEFLEQSLIVSG